MIFFVATQSLVSLRTHSLLLGVCRGRQCGVDFAIEKKIEYITMNFVNYYYKCSLSPLMSLNFNSLGNLLLFLPNRAGKGFSDIVPLSVQLVIKLLPTITYSTLSQKIESFKPFYPCRSANKVTLTASYNLTKIPNRWGRSLNLQTTVHPPSSLLEFNGGLELLVMYR